MSKTKGFIKKRIFYFNVTYGCNSCCVFCYSHNTRHGSKSYNHIDICDFFEFISKQKVTSNDRIIINGGEPMLHPNIVDILDGLIIYGCEVLIYTNGRLLCKNDLSNLNSNYRFVTPIHGYEDVHDQITGVGGSYNETIKGLEYLVQETDCLVDVKLIINSILMKEDIDGSKLIKSFDNEIRFNNAIHITKMADTIVSLKNNCKTISNKNAAEYTNIFFDYFSSRKVKIKIFDTCIKSLKFLSNCDFERYQNEIAVYFKDYNQYRELDISRKLLSCMDSCAMASKCISALNEYKVLELWDGRIFENLE